MCGSPVIRGLPLPQISIPMSLATCSDAAFTGPSIVMGAETTTVCVARLGIVLASEAIAIGGCEGHRSWRVPVTDSILRLDGSNR